ncbi:MAG: HD domain-containing protein [Deltaproteobacteria bacterium]|jgi:HD-GYP domain-containing protein (c-di-GMP phosphodiesterase class II)|nr:HD domain-containing protein [Deltaproteobacteria bacterium]
MNLFSISPVNLMRTLAMALDLAVDGVSLHQKRVAIMCGHIAEKIGLKSQDEQALLSAALMHDIGAASFSDERKKISNPNFAGRPQEIFVHAENGYILLKDSEPFSFIAETIRHHHDQWSGGNPSGLVGDRIPLHSRIIHLADRVEINIDKKKPILACRADLQKLIKANHGQVFDPAVIEAFLDCSVKESFWLDLTMPDYVDSFKHRMNLGVAPYNINDLVKIAELFATLIDRMSRYTATHSRSVSGVAVFLAKLSGFSDSEQQLMKISGLLHDLGKLSIPNEILEKPGPLDPEQLLTIRQHTFFTYRILSQIENMETVAAWAAWHHETLDGQGYPFRLGAVELTIGARIMAVADIFVALTENRPYRKKLDQAVVEKIMRDMVGKNKIAGNIVANLMANYQDAEEIVLSQESFTQPATVTAV